MAIVHVIGAPERPPLEPAVIGRLARELRAVPVWLAPQEACRLTVERLAPTDAARIARGLLADRPVDLIVLPTAPPPCRLLISDVDSTLITIECIDELADYAGFGPEVAAITARAMEGELDFEAALDQRAALLAGLPSTVFAELYRDRCRLMPGAATLAATLRSRGVTTAMVSGGFLPLVDHLRTDLGFDLAVANRLEVRGDHLTGRVCPPIVDGRRKRVVLEQLCHRHGLDRAATMAVGDGANDLAMLAAAGLGVAFRAKPKVALAAPHRIDHGDLTALLFLLGIPRSAFVSVPTSRPPVRAAAGG